ncbi:S-layer homology domain-containing protein [Alkalicoccus urumqiensis]|uniref:SLH domain-containing protein n=1 Tax=Alkalicoccus urumqiensis TaxID=1548213 RepID=A0A2P6ML38_ALKUR|nr:S-layer homology domain-containing protein [Alkalicoccus urumqiensis]PRO66990.1 hypothetical protein C6I21_00015 [Alkalicoccus urumqiensis]
MKNSLLGGAAAFFVLASAGTAAAETKEEPLSPGVEWRQETGERNGQQQALNVLKVNTGDTYTTLDLSIPEPLRQTSTVLNQALAAHSESERVVGAINASFFETGGVNVGLPANLLVDDGDILRFGRNSSSTAGYNFYDQAFGLAQDGTAMIDEHSAEAVLTLNGTSVEAASINNIREGDGVSIFTPDHVLDTPGTNASGSVMELTVEGAGNTEDLSFGETYSGVITDRNERNPETNRWELTNSEIPDDGFVVAVHGTALDGLEDVQIGEEVSLELDIEPMWQEAAAVFGSGPFLVKDGERFITMNPDAGQASTRAPRTAVGISADGSDVFFVTADGRQPGYAAGMTITELADYLVELGADRAINLDGGGSTQMTGMKPGFGFPTLLNQPTENRRVSTTLQVKDSSPLPQVSEPFLKLDNMTTAAGWYTRTVRAEAEVGVNSRASEPRRADQNSTRLSYDFTTSSTGTKAAYMKRAKPFLLHDNAEQLGIWVYGDGAGHWMRGYVYDSQGERYTVDFTDENGVDFTGWRWLTADLPQNVPQPLTFDEIYLAQPDASKQNQGAVAFSDLEVLYEDKQVNRFPDVSTTHWARSSILALNNSGVITGYMDGTFQPSRSISREQAATMLVRELNLDTTGRENPSFTDVNTNRQLYPYIAAVAEEGLMTGFSDGGFQPAGELTRAELAAILTRAYQLEGEASSSFPDVPERHWAYENIGILAASNITGGYPDGTFQPSRPVSRAEFSVFMDRVTAR